MDDPKVDYVLVFEAPKIEPPEFRLYYEPDTGKVLFYTCEKPEGNFIVIDALTFACARYDVRVVDGRLSTVHNHLVISKLLPSKEGVKCVKEDISIIANEETLAETQNWKLLTYEL